MRPFASSYLVSLLALASFACTDSSSDPDQGSGETNASASTGDGDGDGDTQTGEALRPNWHQDIAPLVHGSCVGCHQAGSIGPFSLTSYEEASPWAALMSEVVDAGVMPPWGALETEQCQPDHSWRNDSRLSDADVQLLADWVAAGTPEGDPADAVALPTPPSLELSDPSAVLQNPSSFTIAGPSDSFVCMVMDPELDQDVWVTGVQVLADNAEVVHHALIYMDPDNASAAVVGPDGTFDCPGFVTLDGSMQIGSWAPGSVPIETPPEVGFPMPAGSKVIVAYHYHPTGTGDEIDQSSVALRWTTDKPALNAYMGLFGNIGSEAGGLELGPNDPNDTPVFWIPPNVSGHTETMSFEIPDLIPPIDIFTLGTHMHYVGVDMRVWIERDGEELCLLHTPRWDFNWQRNYDVDAPVGDMPKIQGGDVIKIQCTYDNTLNNPFLVEALAEQGLDEPISVGIGEETLDEMCLLLFGLATDLPLENFL